MKNASKLFFSGFLILILSGCLQNAENKPITENKNIPNEITINQNIPKEPDCFRSPDLPPSEVVFYSDTIHGISLEIPFNPKWSFEKCNLTPFGQIENAIVFGPFDPYGYRVYRLETTPLLSMGKTIEAIKQKAQEEITFKQHKLNGVSMLESFPASPGECPGSSLVVFGEKNNFNLSSPCVFSQGGIENDQIVKSIRLLSN